VYYPLTVRDFLDRAEHVYPDRVAIVDEPDQPAPSLGAVTYREMAANARADAAGSTLFSSVCMTDASMSFCVIGRDCGLLAS